MQAIIKKVCGELDSARVRVFGYTSICIFFQLSIIRLKKVKFEQKLAHSVTCENIRPEMLKHALLQKTDS